ncbi:MAG: phage holin family protein [Betaproteobacteria bacterium]
MSANPNPDAPRGVLASAARLGVTLLALVENKCALAANEWETERIWQTRIMLRMIVGALALTFASLFAAAWLVLVLWDWSHALAVLAPGVIFLVIGAVMWRSWAALTAAKPPAFGITRDELRKDRDVLNAFTGANSD